METFLRFSIASLHHRYNRTWALRLKTTSLKLSWKLLDSWKMGRVSTLTPKIKISKSPVENWKKIDYKTLIRTFSYVNPQICLIYPSHDCAFQKSRHIFHVSSYPGWPCIIEIGKFGTVQNFLKKYLGWVLAREKKSNLEKRRDYRKSLFPNSPRH